MSCNYVPRKYTDDELLNFMRLYLDANDRLPTVVRIAEHFQVVPSGVNQKLTRLEKSGVFDRGEHGHLRFARPA